MSEVEVTDAPADIHSFRPARRRKVYRKRFGDDDDEITPTIPEQLPSANEMTPNDYVATDYDNLDVGGLDLSVAELLRLRKSMQRRRVGGIEFTNITPTSQSISTAAQVENVSNGKSSALVDAESVINRFAPQTGQKVDVNKHM